MRQAGWVIVALLLSLAGALVTAVPDLRELRVARIWRLVQTDAAAATLDNVEIRVDAAQAAVLEGMPDRTVVYLRLQLDGTPEDLHRWMACDLALVDGQGRRWLPLDTEAGWEIVELFAGEDAALFGYSCSLSLIMAESGQPALSHQAFLVPTGQLNALRIELAGMKTRPDGVSLPLNPVLRPLP